MQVWISGMLSVETVAGEGKREVLIWNCLWSLYIHTHLKM